MIIGLSMKTTIKYYVLNLLNQIQFLERDIVYIPNDVLGNVSSGLSEKSEKIKYFVNVNNLNKKNVLLYSLFQNDIPLDMIVYCNYLTIEEGKKLERYVKSIKRPNTTIRICILSNIEIEKYPSVKDFCSFDDECFICFDDNCGYYFSEKKDELESLNEWFNATLYSISDLPNHFLHEPLMLSADMVSEAAKVLCGYDHMNSESCFWYHSVWQYLRLCNMVSTPTWHNDFYLNKLNDSYNGLENIRVLISGCADYSTLSYAIFVAKEKNLKVEYDVLDLCETPLFACRWYGKETNSKVNTFKKSIFDLDEVEKYNLITTDAFLTRFTKSETLDILNRWNKALKKSGHVVTTVRIHDEKHICPKHPSKEVVAEFKNKALKRAQIWGRYINCEPEEIAYRAEKYASTMISNPIGTKEEILKAFADANFEIIDLEDVELQGELYLSRYLRIYAVKK